MNWRKKRERQIVESLSCSGRGEGFYATLIFQHSRAHSGSSLLVANSIFFIQKEWREFSHSYSLKPFWGGRSWSIFFYRWQIDKSFLTDFFSLLLQKILANFRFTMCKFLIPLFWAPPAICSATILGRVESENHGPSTPSNGTKKAQSFFGECANDIRNTNAMSRRC